MTNKRKVCLSKSSKTVKKSKIEVRGNKPIKFSNTIKEVNAEENQEVENLKEEKCDFEDLIMDLVFEEENNDSINENENENESIEIKCKEEKDPKKVMLEITEGFNLSDDLKKFLRVNRKMKKHEITRKIVNMVVNHNLFVIFFIYCY